MRYLLFLLAITAAAQPVLRTESKGGITRAILLHAQTSEPVTDESPAQPGETLIAFADNLNTDHANDRVAALIQEGDGGLGAVATGIGPPLLDGQLV